MNYCFSQKDAREAEVLEHKYTGSSTGIEILLHQPYIVKYALV